MWHIITVLAIAGVVFGLLRLTEPYWHKTHTCHRRPGHNGDHKCWICGGEWE